MSKEQAIKKTTKSEQEKINRSLNNRYFLFMPKKDRRENNSATSCR